MDISRDMAIKIKKGKNKSSGFTIIELIFSVLIFVIGVLGVYSVQTKIVADTTFAVDKLIASYLSQEGIEIVRNIRDTNWVNGVDWKYNLPTGNWEADYSDHNLVDSYTGDKLYIDNNHLYGYSHSPGSQQTKFQRKISISSGTDSENNDFLAVVSTVYWENRGKTYNVSAQENLYNWYGQ